MIVLGAELGWVDIVTAAASLAWAVVTAAVALTRLGIRRELLGEGLPPAAGPEPPLAAAMATAPATVPSTAVATTVLDLARRGLVDIWRDERFGVLVRARSALAGSTRVAPALAAHEAAVLRLIATRTAHGPLPAEALFQEAAPSPARWREVLVTEAEAAASRFQTPRRRRVRHLSTASTLLVLTVSTFAGFTSARRFVEPEVETEDTINSPAGQWFLTFVLVLLATTAVSMIVIGGAHGEDDRRRRARWRRVSSGLAADRDLTTAGPERIGALGHQLVYGAALGHAPAAVGPFTPDESAEATAWTARSGTPRPIAVHVEPELITRGISTSPGAAVRAPSFTTDPEAPIVGEVVRARWSAGGGWWIAVHEGMSDHAIARRLGGDRVDGGPRPPGVGSVVRLTWSDGARAWSADVVETAPSQLIVAARPNPDDLLDGADLRQLFPDHRIEEIPPQFGHMRSYRARRAGGPTVTIQCLVATAGPFRRLLTAASRRRRLPVPGTVYLRGRVRAVIVTEGVTVAVDVTGRRVENRRDLLIALARTVSYRLGVPLDDPRPPPPARR
ncbi:hypothetical protein CcI49_14760 [Frankia sp. CcI49]|uniref:hypothetical protein n=1 Tax=Frankia sp. CcI49 TaxID=1745382 RepID=UPI0009789DAC|nr:hypothetical protein [Frankia sp. CcI49]ONH59967.1 hypothetical protein CcI49_14760 [Frankia sp. CcI49]